MRVLHELTKTREEFTLTILFFITACIGVVIFFTELEREQEYFAIASVPTEEAQTIAKDYLIAHHPSDDPIVSTRAIGIKADAYGPAFVNATLPGAEARAYKNLNQVNESSYTFEHVHQSGNTSYVSVAVTDGSVTRVFLPEDDMASTSWEHSWDVVYQTARDLGHTFGTEDLTTYSSSTEATTTEEIFQFGIPGSLIPSSYGEGQQTLVITTRNGSLYSYYYEMLLPERFQEKLDSNSIVVTLAELFTNVKMEIMLVLAFLAVMYALFTRSLIWRAPVLIAGALTPIFAFIEVTQFDSVFKELLVDAGMVEATIVQITGGIASVVIWFVLMALILAAALSIQTRIDIRRVSILVSMADAHFRSCEFSLAIVRGYLFAFTSFALITACIFVAEYFFGSIRIVPTGSYYDLLESYPIIIRLFQFSLFAALFEELLYRVFGIAFFRKFVRYTVIAALLSSLIWALGHFDTFIFPFYWWVLILMLFGMFLSYVYLRYNVTTAIVVHFVYNALVGATFALANTTFLSLQIGSLFIILFPALLGIVAYIASCIHTQVERKTARA